jgi:hypothetical protein
MPNYGNYPRSWNRGQTEEENLRGMFPGFFGGGLLPQRQGRLAAGGRDLGRFTAPGVDRKTAKRFYPAAYGTAAADQFSWLTGGRALTNDELNRFAPVAREGYDPRFGTIGGFGRQPVQPPPRLRSMQGVLPQQPIGGGGAITQGGGKGLPGTMAAGGIVPPIVPGIPGGGGPELGDFFTQGSQGTGLPVGGMGGGKLPALPEYQEKPVPEWAMRDVEALQQLPYQLMDQYKRVADEGIYGIPGINTIIQTGIRPAQEKYKQLVPDTLTTIRQHEAHVRNQAAQALAKNLGGKFASQPGLAAKLIGDQILSPSLARQAEATIDLKTQTANKLAALDLAVGDLMKENMQSKMMGLAGVQDTMGFLQKRVADRWWDLTLENKYGWSPERTANARATAQERLMEIAHANNMTMAQLETLLREWLMKREFELGEDYG